MRLAAATAGALMAATLGATCARSRTPQMAAATAPPPAAVVATPVVASSADVFTRDIAPLLAQRCAPCHKPGGSMYAKLPFDDPATVRGHREGILRRLKGDDHATVARWLDAP
jgi:mono/diheme cytochrome c family protein